MEFKRLSEDMTENEIKIVLEMVFSSSARLVRYERQTGHNYIEVFFRLPSDGVIHRMDLLPDNLYDMDDGEGYDKELRDGNVNWEYMKFTVARGYSELWVNNQYIENQ